MPRCYSIASNMRRYGQQLQNRIILFYCVFLFPLRQISLSPLTLSHFFSLCHSLSLPSPPYSRKLLKITLQSSPPISPPHFPVLATNLASPHRWSCRLILHNSSSISPPHRPTLVADIHSPHRWPLDLS